MSTTNDAPVPNPAWWPGTELTFVLPAYYASALINGDWTGLDDDEAAELEAWWDAEAVDVEFLAIEEDEPFISRTNDGPNGHLLSDCFTYKGVQR